jgi:hypothetical protein
MTASTPIVQPMNVSNNSQGQSMSVGLGTGVPMSQQQFGSAPNTRIAYAPTYNVVSTTYVPTAAIPETTTNTTKTTSKKRKTAAAIAAEVAAGSNQGVSFGTGHGTVVSTPAKKKKISNTGNKKAKTTTTSTTSVPPPGVIPGGIAHQSMMGNFPYMVPAPNAVPSGAVTTNVATAWTANPKKAPAKTSAKAKSAAAAAVGVPNQTHYQHDPTTTLPMSSAPLHSMVSIPGAVGGFLDKSNIGATITTTKDATSKKTSTKKKVEQAGTVTSTTSMNPIQVHSTSSMIQQPIPVPASASSPPPSKITAATPHPTKILTPMISSSSSVQQPIQSASTQPPHSKHNVTNSVPIPNNHPTTLQGQSITATVPMGVNTTTILPKHITEKKKALPKKK